MGYIKSKDHLFNLLSKRFELSEGCFNRDESIPIEEYVHMLYGESYMNKFTWELRSDATLFEKRNFFTWINREENRPKQLKR